MTTLEYGISLPQLDKPKSAQSVLTTAMKRSARRPHVSEKIGFVLDEIDKKEKELKCEMERVTQEKQKTEKKKLWISKYLRETPDIFNEVHGNKYMIHVCSCSEDPNLQKERIEGLHYVIDKLEEEIRRQQSSRKDMKRDLREERGKMTSLVKQL